MLLSSDEEYKTGKHEKLITEVIDQVQVILKGFENGFLSRVDTMLDEKLSTKSSDSSYSLTSRRAPTPSSSSGVSSISSFEPDLNYEHSFSTPHIVPGYSNVLRMTTPSKAALQPSLKENAVTTKSATEKKIESMRKNIVDESSLQKNSISNVTEDSQNIIVLRMDKTNRSNLIDTKQSASKILKSVPVINMKENVRDNKLVIQLPSSKDKQLAKELLSKSSMVQTSNILVDDTKKMLPKITVANIPNYILTDIKPNSNMSILNSQTREKIKSVLKQGFMDKNEKLRKLVVEENKTFDIVFVKTGYNYTTAGIKVSPIVRKLLLDQGFVYIADTRSKVFDRLDLKQCFKCQKLGHISTDCHDQGVTCMYCGASHRTGACPQKVNREKHRCVNCSHSEDETLRSNCHTHHSGEESCPIIMKALDRLTSIYRSPSAALSCITDFLTDFDRYLEELMHLPGKIIITGDFNIHMENKEDPDTKKFTSLLERMQKSGRKINGIDIDSFKTDILHSELNCPDKFTNCDNAVEVYIRTLTEILDKHAPIVTFSVNPDQSKWINSECQDARRKRRKAERDNRRLKTQGSKDDFKRLCKQAEEILTRTRDDYYKTQLSISDNKKDTYRIVNNLMDRQLSQKIFPNIKEGQELCEEMKDFFVQKVESIYSNIENNVDGIKPEDYTESFGGAPFSQFKPVSEDELRVIIKELNKKECEEDPIPLKIFMQCLNELMQILLFIINDSLINGRFPSLLKNALLRPAIKDESGDINSYKNYRPISNLPFLSKILEKAVQKQLDKHLDTHNLHAEHQSGYRKDHSCETATLTIYNDVLCLNDTKSKVVLLLLDLSAAFDTVNHEILLAKLKKVYGLRSNVLNWFKSYLSDRAFTVTINGERSSKCYLRIGVPQGSILGPILFILYTKELSSIAKKHGFSIHLYADDTQLYIEFNPLIQNFCNIEERIIACLKDIKIWMEYNKLKLNSDKTEVLLTQTRNNFFTFNVEDIILDHTNEKITPSPVVKSLGILFDEYLTFEKQVDTVVKTCNMHLRNLRVIGSKLSYDLKRQLIHCLIFSKLDYCNGLLYGLPDYLINKLQKVQNSCVRFLFGNEAIQRWDRVSSFLKQAHFLPVHRRIEYKIALTVFKCLNNMAPQF
ncbi:hypothetical protein ACHWQZ_G018198 [Mnemiopsis leidyi]